MNTTSGTPVRELRPKAGSSGSSAPRVGGSAPVGVTVKRLTHRFGDLHVLDELSLDVAAGEVLGIVGPSGSGKTTLLELIAGLRELSGVGADSAEGAAALTSIEIGSATSSTDRLAQCAYMPQRDLLLPWLRAIDNAAIALRNRGLSRAEARAAAAPNFKRFGLAGFELARPDELSGGMRQRVAFLRTLLAGKPVLLLDEPFGALDAITRGEMQEWLGSTLVSEPRTVLFVTHDVEEALYVCDRIVILGPRPASVIAELAAPSPRSIPRIDAITDAEFTSVREQALERLTAGAR
jgi:ABC-type nitrate/sulfonate/bicarbonate transport system ATPase subunit